VPDGSVPVRIRCKTDRVIQSLGGTEVHDFSSKAVGDTFRIFIGQCGSNPEAALVVADGNGLFGLTVDTIRLMQIPGLVLSLLVVGIGYPGAETVIETVEARTRDLTPTPSKEFKGSGHADDFLTFIRTELHPWLADKHPEAANDLTYFGHSLGGLFGAYALVSNTALFRRYILSSPSLWWDNEAIFDLALASVDRGVNAEVFFGIGSLETDAGRRLEGRNLPDGHPFKPPAAHLDMVDDTRRFVAQLESQNEEGRKVTSIEIADEFHATVPAVVLNRALREFYD